MSYADAGTDYWPGPPVADEPSELPELTEEQRAELRKLREERTRTSLRQEALNRKRASAEADELYAAETAPRSQRYGAREFLSRPRPARLVPNLLYRDSLARMWGKPGCGKSFVALDLALRVSLGMRWAGQSVDPGPVFYVMAEGAAINAARTDAWLEHHGVDPERLYETDNLHVYDEAIPLVEGGISQLLEDVTELQPVLIILDTKNAMMVGEENSATDAAKMRRALDTLRRASSACVLLVDHAGYEGAHARGSTAVRAAMDTELQVTSEGDAPQQVKVAVDRDKAAETGFTRRFDLTSVGDAAVLVRPKAVQDSLDDALDDLADDTPDVSQLDWRTAPDLSIPDSVGNYEGEGQGALPDLARFMAYEAAKDRGDPGGIGRSRAEAEREFRGVHGKGSIHRAWSALQDLAVIAPADGVKLPTGRHQWVA